MSGEGKMTWPNGQVYEGQYEDDKKSGYGKLLWPDNRAYQGQWLSGKQHGRGTYTDAHNRSWTGDWDQGRKVDPRRGGAGDARNRENSEGSSIGPAAPRPRAATPGGGYSRR
eukprot:NODE_16446_length_994_cov_5.507497.p2 GENE.NODE_16446_length_994_cov_5.507497~~NODE_16446_length_994_cov_5.507497.p2  ORF type:complete len:112 (+),score=15.41 NODE_16446_length_994_cov_5.507497:267-602(+)